MFPGQSRTSRYRRFRPAQRALFLEPLEDRSLLATLVVNTLVDDVADDSQLSLREAIEAVNAGSSANLDAGALAQINTSVNDFGTNDFILFDPDLTVAGDATISLTNYDTGLDAGEQGPTAFIISTEVTIQGPGSSHGIYISRDAAADPFRLFHVTAAGNLTLVALSITGGLAIGADGADGATPESGSAGMGGAIFNQGELAMVGVTVSDNTALGGNGGIGSGDTGGDGGDGLGGAIYNDAGGVVALVISTLSGNAATGGDGGAGNVDAGEAGSGLGGAVFNLNGDVSIINSTLAFNSVSSGATGSTNFVITDGGSIYNLGDGDTANLVVVNAIVSNSTGSVHDLVGSTINAGTNMTSGTNNVIVSGSGFAGTNTITTDPGLGQLEDNGGPTFTHAIDNTSSAFDAGDNVIVMDIFLDTDQRGATRISPSDGTVDIGAFEVVPNQAPTATDNSYDISEEETLTGNLLTDDTGSGIDGDFEPGPLTLLAINGQIATLDTQFALPSGALLTVSSNGDFTYTPSGAFDSLALGVVGTDEFTYQISDGSLPSAAATVTISLTGENDPPIANDDVYDTDEDISLSGNVLTDGTADSDPDSTITVTAVNGETTAVGTQITLPSGALLTLNSDGSFTYDQNGIYNFLAASVQAVDSFTYTIADSENATDDATVTITITGINDAPVATDDDFGTDEDTSTAGNVLTDGIADSDAEGDTLTVTEVNGSASDIGQQITLSSGALLTLNSNGTFNYDPNGQFETLGTGEQATDTFNYTVSDGNGGSTTATVTITITGVNDAPVASDNDYDSNEDDILTGSLLADDTGNGPDSDPEDDTLSVSLIDGQSFTFGQAITLASGALLTVNANGTFSYDPNGVFDLLPGGDFDSDSFTYEVSDGSLSSNTATVTITIEGINDAPIASDDAYTVDEDSSTSGNVLTDGTPDSDAEGDTLTVTEVNGSASGIGQQITLSSGALLTLNSDGTLSYETNAAFESLGSSDQTTDTFTYTVSDGNGGSTTATVTFTITGVNDAPTAVDNAYSTGEDATLAGNIITDGTLNNVDSDPESDTLTVTSVNGLAGNVGTQITLSSGALLTVQADGTFSYDPNGIFNALPVGQTATDSFTYVITDGALTSNSATVTITIDGENDAPIASDDDYNTDQNTPVSGNVLSDNTADVDPDGESVTVTAVNGTAISSGQQITLPSGALLTINSDGTFTYDPNDKFNALGSGDQGTDSFTYTVSDPNNATDSGTVTITIDGTNDAPTATDDAYTTDEDVTVSGNVLTDDTIDGTDSDPDGDELTVTSVNGLPGNVGQQITLSSGALLTVNADGTFTYDPNGVFDDLYLRQTATDTFTYVVTDSGSLTSNSATVTITIVGKSLVPSDFIIGFDPASGMWYASNLTTGAQQMVAHWRPDNGWHNVMVADYNGDGVPDISALSRTGRMWVGLADPGNPRVFQARIWGGTTSHDLNAMHQADVNGDGMVDMITFSQTGGSRWRVFTSDGTRFTKQIFNWASSRTWTDFAVADFNGDGMADFGARVQETGNYYIALSDGAGSFTSARVWDRLNGLVDLRAADYDGDGKADLLGRDPNTGSWTIAQSDGSFLQQRILDGRWEPDATAGWHDVLVADLNGDGKQDIVGFNAAGKIFWIHQYDNGNDGFSKSLATWGSDKNYQTIFAADLDGDGDDQLFGRRGTTGGWRIDELNEMANGLNNIADDNQNPNWDQSVDWLFAFLGSQDGDLF